MSKDKQNPLTGLFNKLGLGAKQTPQARVSKEIRGLDDLFPARVDTLFDTQLIPAARPSVAAKTETIIANAQEATAAPLTVEPAVFAKLAAKLAEKPEPATQTHTYLAKPGANNDQLVVVREAKAPIPKFQPGVLNKVRWPGDTAPVAQQPAKTAPPQNNLTRTPDIIAAPPKQPLQPAVQKQVENYGTAWVTTGENQTLQPAPQPVLQPSAPQASNRNASRPAAARPVQNTELDSHIDHRNRQVNHSINSLVEGYFQRAATDETASTIF